MQTRAVLFDLFGTVIHFAQPVPSAEAPATRWRAMMQWLREAAERELPEVRFESLLSALLEVTGEMVRQRPPEYLEVPSRERFRRALARLGVDGTPASAVAERLSLAHMQQLAAMTHLPAEHPGVLRALAARRRLGVVSNFDHGATARRILADHGVAGFFDVIVISDEFGRRKPHPAIFEAALRGLQVDAADALFVGDSVSDDLVGARNAKLPVVWINAGGQELPADAPAPDHVIASLTELPALID